MARVDEPASTPDLNDTPPTGEEAKAQSRETTMPLIWIGLGALAILLFAMFAVLRGPGDNLIHDAPAAAANPGPPAGR
jgi:hypothetical protein